MDKEKVFGGIIGVCVGDALGVPVEFKSRLYLKEHPVRDMLGYGTHHQPKGTWSDDSSLTLCLVESLCNGLDLKDIAERFLKWLEEGYWTPYGKVFDVGNTTMLALLRFKEGISPELAGLDDEFSNGNGSLMRILPLAFYVHNLALEKQFEITHKVSSITHRHIRSQMACGIYIQFAIGLLEGLTPSESYERTKKICLDYYTKKPYIRELMHLERILKGNIAELSKDEIISSGYVVDSLEASLWSFLTSNSFEEAVLKGINLGGDTDTVGAITGGIAGIYYGYNAIPTKWIDCLARKEDIINLCERFHKSLV